MSELTIVSYDISRNRRRTAVARALADVGTRVQRSVFELYLDSDELGDLQARLGRLIDRQTDSVRYYSLCKRDAKNTIVDGTGVLTRDWDYYVA